MFEKKIHEPFGPMKFFSEELFNLMSFFGPNPSESRLINQIDSF